MNESATDLLKGRGILVTRPAHQAEAICALIEAAGGRAWRLPLLEIRPALDAAAVQAGLARLADYDIAIFVSANAVNFALDALDPRPWPPSLATAAVGAATARALEQRGLRVTYCPRAEFTSEALLALPALQDMRGRRVVILRGNGGREQLRETLRARGARVDYLEVYRRVQPEIDPAPWRERWHRGAIAAALVSSGETLRKLHAIVATLGHDQWRKTALIVAHARIRDLARELCIDGPVRIADDATDAAMVKALCDHFAAAEE